MHTRDRGEGTVASLCCSYMSLYTSCSSSSIIPPIHQICDPFTNARGTVLRPPDLDLLLPILARRDTVYTH